MIFISWQLACPLNKGHVHGHRHFLGIPITLQFVAALKGFKFLLCCWLVLMVAVTPVWSFSNGPIHHHLRIELEPSSRFARIEDTIQFKPSRENCASFVFYLHADLKLNRHQVPTSWQMQIATHKSAEPRLIKIEISKSRSATCPETFSMVLDYSGILYDADDPAGSGGSFFPAAVIFTHRRRGLPLWLLLSCRFPFPNPGRW